MSLPEILLEKLRIFPNNVIRSKNNPKDVIALINLISDFIFRMLATRQYLQKSGTSVLDFCVFFGKRTGVGEYSCSGGEAIDRHGMVNSKQFIVLFTAFHRQLPQTPHPGRRNVLPGLGS